jgi:HSP20 family protein
MRTLNFRPLHTQNVPNFSNFIESIFNDNVPAALNSEWYRNAPLVNIKDTAESYQIEVAAPGFSKESFSVKVEDNTLTIAGEHSGEQQTEGEKYTRKEFGHQSFSRSFTLPKRIDASKIAGVYENGILKVTLPKPEEEKPKAAVEVKIA